MTPTIFRLVMLAFGMGLLAGWTLCGFSIFHWKERLVLWRREQRRLYIPPRPGPVLQLKLKLPRLKRAGRQFTGRQRGNNP